MKRCELCDRAARMYCESDEASLCWDCDAKVHSANFLVERHPRLLLCQRCQAPTTWRATGARLSPIISSCDRCMLKDFPNTEEQQDENQVAVNDSDRDEDEHEDCQVVPWRPTPPPPPPPPPASSSSGEESSSLSSCKARSRNSLKRIREKEDFGSEKDESRPFYQRRRSRNHLFFEAPFSSRIDGNEKDHRISFVQSDALFSVDSGEKSGSRACARRASNTVDLISSASCSPPI